MESSELNEIRQQTKVVWKPSVAYKPVLPKLVEDDLNNEAEVALSLLSDDESESVDGNDEQMDDVPELSNYSGQNTKSKSF